MDLTDLQETLNTPQAHYIIGATIAVLSGAIGYFTGGLMSKKRFKYTEMQHNEKLSCLELEKEKAKIALEAEKHKIEVLKLEHEEKEREYNRLKEKLEIEYKREIETEERQRLIRQQEMEQRRSLIEKLSTDLGNSLESYVKVSDGLDGNLEVKKRRQEYREKICEEFVEYWRGESEIYRNNFSIDENDKDKIEKLVDMKFPLADTGQLKTMGEINRLYNMLVKELHLAELKPEGKKIYL